MALAGQLLLYGASFLSIVCVMSFAVATRREAVGAERLGRLLVRLVWLLVTAASGILILALVNDKFSFVYVAEHSRRTQPLIFKLAAWWSGQEGSLLFWLWLLTGYTVLVERTAGSKAPPRLRRASLAVLASLIVFFALMTAVVASPFATQSPPVDGEGMSPLLQSYWMVLHPLFLYLGYVGFSVPAAFALGGLMTRHPGRVWLRLTRRWSLLAWLFLTVGIIYGGRWAYEELGWGGFWGWDPVENASLMPWLSATAYIHSTIVEERRGMLKRWNVLLVLLTFFLTVFGTFITRTGILTSVHAFVTSPVAPWFMNFMGVFAAISFYLFLSRSDVLNDDRGMISYLSKEGSFLVNNWLFLSLVFAVFWGTVFPLLSGMIGYQVTVATPYFNRVTGPLFLTLIAFMGVSPALAWRRTSLHGLRITLGTQIVQALLFVLGLVVVGVRAGVVLFALAAAFFSVVTVIVEVIRGVDTRSSHRLERWPVALWRLVNRNPRRYGGYLVHVGVALVVVAITVSQYYQVDLLTAMSMGDQRQVGPYRVEFRGVEQRDQVIFANMVVSKNGKPIGLLRPEKKYYPGVGDSEGPTTEAAIYSTWLGDLYIVLSGWDTYGAKAGFKLYFNPMVLWLWLGGFIVVIGTLFSLWPRRVRNAVLEERITELRDIEYDYRMGRLAQPEYVVSKTTASQGILDVIRSEDEIAQEVRARLSKKLREGANENEEEFHGTT